MATKIFAVAIPASIIGVRLERTILPSLVPALFEPSAIAALPKAFGVPMLLLVASAFWLTLYGFEVGAARK
jgi:glutathione S-transferase